MKEVVIVGGARTAVGDFFGAVKDLGAIDLGIIAFKGALEKSGITAEQVESIVAGHTCQAGVPGNIARLISLNSGCKPESYAATVHQQCPSSMRAAEIISHEIMLGKVDIGAAVGTESMTNVPYVLNKARSGYRLGHGEQLLDSMYVSGLICPWNGYHMGVTAENIAEQY
ncbi:MAG: acetyl-CoA C-acetyltransferase, partial [Syntrophomonadaceae bacterium]|nr:acetyl-CoA C-acetyltransferase [Syntrophomonadaceae bacterium]